MTSPFSCAKAAGCGCENKKQCAFHGDGLSFFNSTNSLPQADLSYRSVRGNTQFRDEILPFGMAPGGNIRFRWNAICTAVSIGCISQLAPGTGAPSGAVDRFAWRRLQLRRRGSATGSSRNRRIRTVGGSTWSARRPETSRLATAALASTGTQPEPGDRIFAAITAIAVHIEGVTHLFVRCQSAAAFIAPFDMAFHAGCFV